MHHNASCYSVLRVLHTEIAKLKQACLGLHPITGRLLLVGQVADALHCPMVM